MKRIGSLVHKTSKEISGSMWAINYSEHPDRGWPFSVEKAAQSGCKWARCGVRWSEVEKTNGNYCFDKSDGMIFALVENGIAPYVLLSGGNFLYMDDLVGYPPVREPETMDAYMRFIDAVVCRYQDLVFNWEIWNEANWVNFWKPYPDAKEYAQLVCAVSDVIRKYQGDKATIIVGALTGIGTGLDNTLEFAEALLKTQAKGTFNAVSYHPYHQCPEETMAHIASLIATVHKYDDKLAVWNGECGYASSGDTIHGRTVGPWGPKVQAKWLLRRALCDLLSGLELSTYFFLVETHHSQEQYDRKEAQVNDSSPRSHYVGTNTKGLIRYDGTEKYAFGALKNLTTLVDSSYTRVEADTSYQIKEEGVFFGAGKSDREFLSPYDITMVSDKGNLLLYWLPWHMQEIIEPGVLDIKVRGLAFTDPVLVDLMTGIVYDASWTNENGMTLFYDMPLTDYPMALLERTSVQYL